jgi:hypothetical protein
MMLEDLGFNHCPPRQGRAFSFLNPSDNAFCNCKRSFLQVLLYEHRALSGYDNYSVSWKGARIAKVVLRSRALRKREKFWREMAINGYQALREAIIICNPID